MLRGMRSQRELHVVHSCHEVRGAVKVIDGVYVGASLKHAAQVRCTHTQHKLLGVCVGEWDQAEAELTAAMLCRQRGHSHTIRYVWGG